MEKTIVYDTKEGTRAAETYRKGMRSLVPSIPTVKSENHKKECHKGLV